MMKTSLCKNDGNCSCSSHNPIREMSIQSGWLKCKSAKCIWSKPKSNFFPTSYQICISQSNNSRLNAVTMCIKLPWNTSKTPPKTLNLET
jgi:hypothetical protein